MPGLAETDVGPWEGLDAAPRSKPAGRATWPSDDDPRGSSAYDDAADRMLAALRHIAGRHPAARCWSSATAASSEPLRRLLATPPMRGSPTCPAAGSSSPTTRRCTADGGRQPDRAQPDRRRTCCERHDARCPASSPNPTADRHRGPADPSRRHRTAAWRRPAPFTVDVAPLDAAQRSVGAQLVGGTLRLAIPSWMSTRRGSALDRRDEPPLPAQDVDRSVRSAVSGRSRWPAGSTCRGPRDIRWADRHDDALGFVHAVDRHHPHLRPTRSVPRLGGRLRHRARARAPGGAGPRRPTSGSWCTASRRPNGRSATSWRRLETTSEPTAWPGRTDPASTDIPISAANTTTASAAAGEPSSGAGAS